MSKVIIKSMCFIKMFKASWPLYFILNSKKISLFQTDRGFRIFLFICFYLIYPYISAKHVQTSCGTSYKLLHEMHRRKQRCVIHRLRCPYQDNTVPAGTFFHQHKGYIFKCTINVGSQYLTI